jgi:ribosomal protein S18 acetylase RimI-like enzyme
MNFLIQRAVTGDYEIIKSILNESDLIHLQALPEIFKDPKGNSWDKDYVISLINNLNSDIFLAKDEKKIVGVMVLIVKSSQNLAILKTRQFVALDCISIKEQYQNRGIGKMLLKKMEDWAYEKGIFQIELNVYEFNYNAIRLYKNLGFRTYSRRMIKILKHD